MAVVDFSLIPKYDLRMFDFFSDGSYFTMGGALRLSDRLLALVARLVAIAIIVNSLSQNECSGSLIPFDALLYTAVSNNTSPTQDSFLIGPPSLPYGNSHTAALGPSTSTAQYAFQQGANFVDYLINVQHTCVQQASEDTRCRSQGSIDFTPRSDVLVEIEGIYNYHMNTIDMLSSAGARIYRMGTPSVILFGDGGSAQTVFNGNANGAIPLSASGVVPAGFHYHLFYTTQISYIGGQPTTSTADGYIRFRVTEVPEPTAFGALAFAFLLMRKRRFR